MTDPGTIGKIDDRDTSHALILNDNDKAYRSVVLREMSVVSSLSDIRHLVLEYSPVQDMTFKPLAKVPIGERAKPGETKHIIDGGRLLDRRTAESTSWYKFVHTLHELGNVKVQHVYMDTFRMEFRKSKVWSTCYVIDYAVDDHITKVYTKYKSVAIDVETQPTQAEFRKLNVIPGFAKFLTTI